jgi:hypothetical protein
MMRPQTRVVVLAAVLVAASAGLAQAQRPNEGAATNPNAPGGGPTIGGAGVNGGPVASGSSAGGGGGAYGGFNSTSAPATPSTSGNAWGSSTGDMTRPGWNREDRRPRDNGYVNRHRTSDGTVEGSGTGSSWYSRPRGDIPTQGAAVPRSPSTGGGIGVVDWDSAITTSPERCWPSGGFYRSYFECVPTYYHGYANEPSMLRTWGNSYAYPWGYLLYGGYYSGDPNMYGYATADSSLVGPGMSVRPGASYGGVRLKVKPAEAKVFVDGYFAGKVDDFDGFTQSLPITLGPHRIEISMPGYEPLVFDVDIKDMKVVTREGSLKPIK